MSIIIIMINKSSWPILFISACLSSIRIQLASTSPSHQVYLGQTIIPNTNDPSNKLSFLTITPTKFQFDLFPLNVTNSLLTARRSQRGVGRSLAPAGGAFVCIVHGGHNIFLNSILLNSILRYITMLYVYIYIGVWQHLITYNRYN